MKSIPTIHRAEQRRLLQGERDRKRLEQVAREQNERDSGGRGEAWKQRKQDEQFAEWRESKRFD